MWRTRTDRADRQASVTTQQLAFLAGTTEAGLDTGVESGALNNYPRFLEDWNSRALNLVTSFASLYEPRHSESAFVCCPHYRPPIRNWDFDVRFRAGQLPPMTPRFTYSRQEMFTRDFEW